jgi:8-oxo-dGTP diphosphatase
MRLFLIRHAQAGDRISGQRDLYRPLTPKGHRRAQELAEMLSEQGITHVMTSPAIRCVQTVAPLAYALGVEAEEHSELWEGTPAATVLSLLENHQGAALAVCSHGDVIPDVIDALAKAGVPISGRGCEKGSVWVLDHNGRTWTSASYFDRSHTRLPPT